MPTSLVRPSRSIDVDGLSDTAVDEEKISCTSNVVRSLGDGEASVTVENSSRVGTERRLSRQERADPEFDLDI